MRRNFSLLKTITRFGANTSIIESAFTRVSMPQLWEYVNDDNTTGRAPDVGGEMFPDARLIADYIERHDVLIA